MFFVIAPSIAVAIAYAAWRGKPKSFDREMYWTVFVATCAVAAVIIVYSLACKLMMKCGFTLSNWCVLDWEHCYLAFPLASEWGFSRVGVPQ